jgi:hypothetical protein
MPGAGPGAQALVAVATDPQPGPAPRKILPAGGAIFAASQPLKRAA